ncbi:MAG: hypothetical protein IPP50_00005 [Piscinibacter sp.]|nr:hypothetical protein [Piscinibacter sp.]
MLNMSVANACIRGSLFDLDEPPSIPGRADAVHTLQLHQLPLQTEGASRSVDRDRGTPRVEAAVVQLHWVLLQELRKLTDPETPLEEKIETLDWALTSPSNDHLPFSFASCVRVVGTSPMSPTAYFGRVDVDELRQWLLRQRALASNPSRATRSGPRSCSAATPLRRSPADAIPVAQRADPAARGIDIVAGRPAGPGSRGIAHW